MKSWKKAVTGLFAGALVAFGVCACGSEPGNDAVAEPPAAVPLGPICPGGQGCACTANDQCTDVGAICWEGHCDSRDRPCGNCNRGPATN